MDGRKFRFHDNHEFFHAACSGDSRRQSPVQGQSVSRSQRLAAPPQESPHPDEHRKHCTAGEIASELGYSVSYILAVKKAMYAELTTLPRRLDPKEVSDWIYAHPAFRMRDVYECHPKASPHRTPGRTDNRRGSKPGDSRRAPPKLRNRKADRLLWLSTGKAEVDLRAQASLPAVVSRPAWSPRGIFTGDARFNPSAFTPKGHPDGRTTAEGESPMTLGGHWQRLCNRPADRLL